MIYNCFLDACVQCGDVERATTHFEEMNRLDFVDMVGYNTVLKSYLTKGWTEQARSLMKEMVSRGMHPNKVTYNELLHAKVTSKDRAGMWSLLAEMQEAGVGVSSVTCSILLKSLTSQSPPWDIKRVMALVDEVEEPMDEVLFSSVIDACIRLKQLDSLKKLLARFKERSSLAKFTAPMYGSMIKAYGQACDIAQVWQLWREMDGSDVTPTSVTLGCMVEAVVINGQADQAWKLVRQQLDSEERRGYINV
jgi:pentatricopeptide repeat protein